MINWFMLGAGLAALLLAAQAYVMSRLAPRLRPVFRVSCLVMAVAGIIFMVLAFWGWY